MKKVRFSNRIYKDALEEASLTEQMHTLALVNQAKRYAFQTMVREKRTGKTAENSLHLRLKARFSLNTYYAHAAEKEAKALFDAQTKLQKLYERQDAEKIKHLKKKMTREKKKLTTHVTIKQTLIKGKLTFPKNSPYSLRPSGHVSQRSKGKSHIWFNHYLFEHRHVDVIIRETKRKLGQLKHRLQRLEEKSKKRKQHVPSVVFGSKALFKHQYTKEQHVKRHDLWQQAFRQQRNKVFVMGGRKDAATGNFVFHYEPDTRTLTYQGVSGKVITMHNVVFPYGQDEITDAITTQRAVKNKKRDGKPMAWSIEDHGAYFLIKCILTVDANPHVNFSTAKGVLGIDLNVDHVAWSYVTHDGNYVRSGRFDFDIIGKTSGQVTKILEAIAILLVDLAHRYDVPIGMEDIDTTLSKTGDAYGNKKANRLKSVFAYRKLTQAITSRANAVGVAVFKNNPAYTSIIGKMKYMRHFGISIHEAAAYVIGRRTLGYKEKIPLILRPFVAKPTSHHWSQWHQLNKSIPIRTHAFYQVYDIDLPHLGVDSEHPILTDYERLNWSKERRKIQA